ncbi:MAG TPA: L,D-transpeptidase family protein [Actinomycetota bacterium]|nr:L,D-transpeptidase family protein [Actinomycetota bacterium]
MGGRARLRPTGLRRGRGPVGLRAAIAGAVAVGVVVPARAAAAPGTVTLEASPAVVTFGGTVALAGTIDPPSAGQVVRVLDGAGAVLGTATTDATGAFALELAPAAGVSVHAEWAGAASPPVAIGVRPRVSAALGAPRLFAPVQVVGEVEPAHPGTSVAVELRRAGRVVALRRATLDEGGALRVAFRVSLPGRYRAVVRFPGDDDHLPARGATAARSTPLPSLAVGAEGPAVRALERRLVELRYHLPGVDGRFGVPTADAVMAFTKVQGMRRRGTVDAAVWRALAAPRRPRPRIDDPGRHVEVDQTRQVLLLVEDGEVTAILHVSTGAGGATRDGAFRVYRKLAGYSPGRLYYPSYFDGLRAIHGWPEVPPYPASHGCVRVPMWSATWVYGRVPAGTRIVIYHSP